MYRRIMPIIVTCFLLPVAPGLAAEATWPGFRGAGDSHAHTAPLPLSWDDTHNIAWTAPLEGYGQSSPVVWNGLAFVTSVPGDDKATLAVTCIDVNSGTRVWQKTFPASQTAQVTDYISKAAPTPVVDSQRVYAFFESGDLVALTHAGEPVWSRSLTADYGAIKGNHGLGSSPAQTDDAVIVLVDHEGPSYLAALDKQTGKTLWKKDRDSRVSWSSPVVCSGTDGPEILISSNGVAQCCSASDGEPIWEVAGLKGNTVASPTLTPDGVLIGAGQPGDSLLIRRGGRGDVSRTHVAWKLAGASSSFGSPLIIGERACIVNKSGVAFAVALDKGDVIWTQRLADSTWASPVASGDRVYFFCKNGTTVVARAAETFDKLAENVLTIEGRVYGVAIVPGTILIRSSNRLTCVRAAPEP